MKGLGTAVMCLEKMLHTEREVLAREPRSKPDDRIVVGKSKLEVDQSIPILAVFILKCVAEGIVTGRVAEQIPMARRGMSRGSEEFGTELRAPRDESRVAEDREQGALATPAPSHLTMKPEQNEA